MVLTAISFEMDFLLDDFQNGKLTFSELLAEAKKICSKSGYNELSQYEALFTYLRSSPKANKIRLHAGCMPQYYSELAVKKGL